MDIKGSGIVLAHSIVRRAEAADGLASPHLEQQEPD